MVRSWKHFVCLMNIIIMKKKTKKKTLWNHICAPSFFHHRKNIQLKLFCEIQKCIHHSFERHIHIYIYFSNRVGWLGYIDRSNISMKLVTRMLALGNSLTIHVMTFQWNSFFFLLRRIDLFAKATVHLCVCVIERCCAQQTITKYLFSCSFCFMNKSLVRVAENRNLNGTYERKKQTKIHIHFSKTNWPKRKNTVLAECIRIIFMWIV